MNLQELKTKAIRVAAKQGHNVRQVSPTILIVAGTASIIGGTVLFMKNSKKLELVVDELNDTTEKMEIMAEQRPEYEESGDRKKDAVKLYTKSTIDIIKIYAPSVLLVTGGVAAIFGSHRILQKRNVALIGAYKTLDKGFKKYRKRVVDEYGEDVDRELMLNKITTKETVVTKNSKGKEVSKEVDVESIEIDDEATYARVFGPGNPNWDGSNPVANFLFVKQVEHYLRLKLYTNGVLFLNDVYKQLGLKQVPAGQVIGWSVSDDEMSEFELGYTLKSGEDLPFPMSDRVTEGIWLNIEPEGLIVDLV